MSKKRSNHSKSKDRGPFAKSEFSGRQLHKDWRVWLVIGLMVAAMAIYVLSLDEALGPMIFKN